MTFLTPLAGLVALAAVLPLAAALFGRTRADGVRRGLGLEAAPARVGLLRPALAAAGIVLLGLAAAQPVLEHRSSQRVRKDVEALFVLDTSRSMAASATATSPTRLDRAIAAAARLRSSIPQVPSGAATLADRVLPDLLPVGGVSSFDAVVRRTVAIETPPQDSTSARPPTTRLRTDRVRQLFRPYGLRRTSCCSRTASNRSTPGRRPRPAAAKGTASSPSASGRRRVRFRQQRKPEADYRPDPSGGAPRRARRCDAARRFEAGSAPRRRRSLLDGSGPTVVTAGETQSRRARPSSSQPRSCSARRYRLVPAGWFPDRKVSWRSMIRSGLWWLVR
jgi:hypothetical protein